MIAIGRLFTTGRLNTERVIALGGSQVNKPRLLRTVLGAKVSQITAGELVDADNRVISGSVLNGAIAQGAHDYLGRYHNQISVIEEGRSKELFGWVAPQPDKYSITRTTLGHFLKNKLFKFTTAVNGGDRAMVPIGTYERVMPRFNRRRYRQCSGFGLLGIGRRRPRFVQLRLPGQIRIRPAVAQGAGNH